MRRLCLGLLLLASLLPVSSFAQTPAQLQAASDAARPNQSDDAVGQVTSVEGSASVTRGGAQPAALKKDDEIFKGDVLQTGANGTLSVTFDDDTTFNLTAGTRVTVDEFIYEEGKKGNKANFNVARGSLAFVASQVAKTGDMKIATPTATMGIRGTTGLVEVPENAGTGGGDARIKLYADSDGRVGRIEVFGPGAGGARLGLLTAASSAFAIRGSGGRFAAVPFAIPPQEAARDRGIVTRLYQSHNFGRQIAAQRRQIRIQRGPGGGRNLAPGNRQNLRPGAPGQPGQRQGLAPGQRPGLAPNNTRPGIVPPGQRPGTVPGAPGQNLAPGQQPRPGLLQRILPQRLLPGGKPAEQTPPRKRLPGERDLLPLPR